MFCFCRVRRGGGDEVGTDIGVRKKPDLIGWARGFTEKFGDWGSDKENWRPAEHFLGIERPNKESWAQSC
jgi:hypothetical protein